MKLITFALLLTSLGLAETPPAAPQPERFPIPQEYVTLFNGLIQNMQAVQKQIQAAEEKLRNDLCKERGIAAPDCAVDWQGGTISKKVAGGPLPTAAPAAKAPEKK